jgi:undecaprenyl-diphosphatase
VSLALIVLLCGLTAALLAFAASASRRLHADPVDPAAPERATRQAIERLPRLRRFLKARMDRKTAGGFLLTVSFAIVFGVALVLGLLLDAINDHSLLARWDQSVADWGAHHARSETIDVLKWITQLGSTPVVVAVLTLTAVADFVRRRKKDVWLFVAAVGIGELLFNNLLKVIVSRGRPAVMHLVVAHGYSFPSGHTTAAAAAWSAVALVLGRDRPRWVRAVLSGMAALVAVSVAASRALLGVHWLTDVIGGLALGWGWFMIVAVIFGGRAQRLGDVVSNEPQGTKPQPVEPTPVA